MNVWLLYTDEKGYDGIINSNEIFPSTKAKRPKDARYGDGQYLTDIEPGAMSLEELSKVLYNNRNQMENAVMVYDLTVEDGHTSTGKVKDAIDNLSMWRKNESKISR